MKHVIITGVSTGIGKGTAAVLLRRGWHVFGSVRRAEDGAVLQREFGNAFTPLLFDVQDENAIAAAAEHVRSALNGRTLAGLVNNAGSAFPDPLLVQSVADFRKQIDINLVGMFAVTRAFAPLLGADTSLSGPKGRIVNLSSVGGKMAAPFLGAYAAAKHGVEGFSESLRRELQLFDIDVIIVGPGAVKTPIWDKAEATPLDYLAGTIWEKPFKAFRDFMITGGRKGLAPEEIGMVIARALTVAHPHTRYAVVKGKFFNVTLPSFLPVRMVDRIIGRRFSLRPGG
jgi:NAD(P)-dependent dehydrogenase (short-subunit alcohol dehydrogenase family)